MVILPLAHTSPVPPTSLPRVRACGRFRYCEVRGLGYAPALSDVVARFVHSDVGQRSEMTITESHPVHPGGLLNKIHENVRMSALFNMISIPTGCPQRDERRGWLGDASLAAELAQFNFFSGPFHHYLSSSLDSDWSSLTLYSNQHDE